MGLPVLALSADEIMWALLRSGFVIVKATSAAIVLERRHRLVSVPLGPLESEHVMAVLRDAGVSYSELLDLLGEAPTEPGLTSGVRLKRL